MITRIKKAAGEWLIGWALLFVAALVVMLCQGAQAATKLVVSCDAPAVRVSGLALPPSEIKDYSFWYKQPDPTAELGPVKMPTCGYTVSIAEGQCVKAGTVFSAVVTDTAGTDSARAVSAPLVVDQCNPKSPPAAPTNVRVTVQ